MQTAWAWPKAKTREYYFAVASDQMRQEGAFGTEASQAEMGQRSRLKPLLQDRISVADLGAVEA